MDKLHRLATVFVLIILYLEADGAAAMFLPDRMQLCGDLLKRTLATVCGGSFNHMYKKNSDSAEISWPNRFPFTTMEAARNPFGLRRRTRGVVDECCNKPCSFHEMQGYCEPTPSSSKEGG